MFRLSFLQKTVLLLTLPTTAFLLYILFRGDEEEDDSDSIVTTRQTVIEVNVPRSAVGAVIGYQGAQIKKIQEECKARLNFKDYSSDKDRQEERVIVIRGSPDSAQRAEIMVRKIITDQPVVLVEEMHVPQKCLGKIIGRGGENIRHIQDVSKARVIIDRTDNRDPNKTRLVTIKGSKTEIDNAKGLINEMVCEFEDSRVRLTASVSDRSTRPGRHHRDLPESQLDVTTETISWPTHGDYIEVYVSAIDTPGHFWVQILSPSSPKLDTLVSDMTDYYRSEQTDPGTVHRGMLVAASFSHDSSWYRAKVINILDNNQIDLYYVDYGDNDVIDRDKVKMLLPMFCQLPYQAIECCLFLVEPIGGQWSDASFDEFESLSHCAKWKVVMGRAEAFSPPETMSGSHIPHLVLIDTSGSKDVNINDELILRGFARRTENSISEENSARRDNVLQSEARSDGPGLVKTCGGPLTGNQSVDCETDTRQFEG